MHEVNPGKLLEAAASVMEKAYAPYSGFRVGSAMLTADGAIVTGCNVENSSLGLTNCAERTALFSAVAAGHTEFAAIAIVADGVRKPYPCGACRQVLAEFCPSHLPVFMACRDNLNVFDQTTLGDLLPKAFRFSASSGGYQ
jgi:cytidine deaminase